jgi:uncharacterized protein
VLDDAAGGGIVDKLVKQRKDSIAAFRRRAAPTWSTRKRRAAVLEGYLPQRCRPTTWPPRCGASWPNSVPQGPADMGA